MHVILKTGEKPASAMEILTVQDLPSTHFCPGINRRDGGFEAFWVRPDGTPLIVVVRAPSHEERREINAAAGDNDDEFILQTCARCIVFDPPIEVAEAVKILRGKHPLALQQIADTAWNLASLPASMVEREVRKLAGLPPAGTPPPPQRADTGAVAAADSQAVRSSDPHA